MSHAWKKVRTFRGSLLTEKCSYLFPYTANAATTSELARESVGMAHTKRMPATEMEQSGIEGARRSAGGLGNIMVAPVKKWRIKLGCCIMIKEKLKVVRIVNFDLINY